ncbi:D-arabinono-1,4-lactone oxidase [Longispora albida]|uniref:D-arabinono-1,4-lactone oxidase n=1 Tax=Longispora albida TaxID=203523 RepID=UPI0003819D7F|nr:D-arabinono-1,4-lactone oxidase [Longispora albida]
MHAWRNWAGNQYETAALAVAPATRDELIDAILGSEGSVKAIGSGHSFSAAAVTTGLRVALDRLAGLISIDGHLVTVQAGMPLHRLNALLAEHGLALPNLGDIDAQTISGAISTGTHGTGHRLGGLATFVEAVELVTASGEVRRYARGDDGFDGVVVGIGALGVLTEVTLRCVDAFTLHAAEKPLPLADVLAGLSEHFAANDHFEFYWFPYTERALTKANNRVPASDRPLSAFRQWLDDDFLSNAMFDKLCRTGRAFPKLVPSITRFSASALSERSYTGSSHEVFCSPRRVKFVEMEYSFPREALREAFAGLRAIIARLPYNIVFPVEVRCAAADELWLSPSYGRDSAYLAIHQYTGMPYEEYFRQFEQLALTLGGRPHWGKLNYWTAEDASSAYPRLADFTKLRDELDPGRRFANDYTNRVLG